MTQATPIRKDPEQQPGFVVTEASPTAPHQGSAVLDFASWEFLNSDGGPVGYGRQVGIVALPLGMHSASK
jgi:hypothetical protein